MKPQDKYTHQFEISLDSAGGKFCIGYCTVDPTANKRSFDHRFEKTSEPVSLDFMEDSLKLLRLIESLNIKYKGIKCIRFEPTKKE